MQDIHIKIIALITNLLFIFLLGTNNIPVYPANEKSGQTLSEDGQRLYQNGEYQGALDIWLQAVPLIKEKEKLAELYFYISLAHFKLEQPSKAEDSLRQMFEIEPKKILKKNEIDYDFLVLYNKVKAEYWFSFRTESKEEKETQQNIIEKLSRKPKKKKKKILSLLIIGFLFVSAVVVTVIVRNKKDDIYGKLLIFNNTDFTIESRIGEVARFIYAREYTTYLLKEGTYDVEIFDIDHSRSQIYSVVIRINQTVSLNFNGWPD